MAEPAALLTSRMVSLVMHRRGGQQHHALDHGAHSAAMTARKEVDGMRAPSPSSKPSGLALPEAQSGGEWLQANEAAAC